MHRTRIAVVSPFLDKRHGTERCVAEQVERLAHDYEIHVYANRVEDIDLRRIVWHRVPALPGPHLLAYAGWFLANHLWRWWGRRFQGLRCDLVYTPGINCLDADLVSVHAVFGEYVNHVGQNLRLRGAPLLSWPRRLHRRIYYALIRALEQRVYTKPGLRMACVSRQVAREISRHYRRDRGVSVIHNAVDPLEFNPEIRLARRPAARREFGLPEEALALLLVGNDWKSKGLTCLLQAMAQLRQLPVYLLVVGKDDCTVFESLIRELNLEGQIKFPEPSSDIMKYYAAADAYVGPSLHDSFALPPLEAMACGLPVITSARNGGSEIMTHGTDGLVLQNAEDSRRLASYIKRLLEDPDGRYRLGENAARTAHRYTWDRNARELMALVEQVLAGEERLSVLEKEPI